MIETSRHAPQGRERIVTHSEGGWIATGICGRPHLVGGGWSWWVCPVCSTPGMRRRLSTERITAQQRRLLAAYYPGPSA